MKGSVSSLLCCSFSESLPVTGSEQKELSSVKGDCALCGDGFF